MVLKGKKKDERNPPSSPLLPAQEELSENRFRLLVESIKDCAIIMVDPHGKIVYWNPGAERLKGYEAHEVLGKDFSLFFTPEDRAKGKPRLELQKALEEGEVETEDWRVRKDGSKFWADVIITPLYDSQGRHLGFAKIVRDLSNRRRMEERLRLSIRAFRALSACNQIIIRATEEQALVNEICHTIVLKAGYPAVWMGLFDEKEEKITLIARAGAAEKLVEFLPLHREEGEESPFKRAITREEPVVVRDLSSPPETPWKKVALEAGLTSMIVFPLILEGYRKGVLSILSKSPDSFHLHEVALLHELANDLAFGLTTIRHRLQREEALKALLEKEQQANIYQKTLLSLSQKEHLGRSSLEEITERAAQTLKVERVSIWTYDPTKGVMTCQDLYNAENKSHEKGGQLEVRNFHRYLRALQEDRIIDAYRAEEDSRTAELKDHYLTPMKTISLLDAPIRREGEVVGVLRIESTREVRHWTAEEKALAASLADLIALHMEHEEKKRLQQEKDKLLTALEQASDSIIITDPQGIILYANRAAQEISGYSLEEMVGSHVRLWKSGKHDQDFYQRLWDTLSKGKAYRAVFTNKRKDGSLFCLDQTITPIKAPGGEVSLFVATGKDITQETLLEEKMYHLAYYDALTNLPNRTLFLEKMEQTLLHTRGESLVFVLVIDLGRLKRINEIYGHETGDSVVMEVSKRLKSLLGERNTLARIGESEFGILLNTVKNLEEVVTLLKSIFDSISKITVGEREIRLEISMGLSLSPHDSRDPRDLLAKAHLALSEAKEKKAPFQFYSREAEEKVREFSIMEKRLSQASDQREFLLFYQPYYHLSTGKLAGMESLLRWRTPDGIVSAGRYIPLLEETGMINRIGNWIFKKACLQIMEWKAQGFTPVPISINISPVQFSQKNLVDTMEGIIRETGIDPWLLTAEITESTFMRDLNHTQQVLRTLKDWGLSVSIDDFGTGYSSLSYLKRLPIDNLKIDISFIRELTQDPDDASIVSAIISLAHNLGLKTIAEGVETEEQWRFLNLLRCDMVQGFYCGRPMPPEEAQKLLKE